MKELAAISAWVDEHPENVARDDEARTWGRVAKVGEEFGEVISAYIGATGQNPRKGTTHTMDDVTKELLDVALTALCAVEHLMGNDGSSEDIFRDHIQRVHVRSLAATSATGAAAEQELLRQTSRCGVLNPHEPHGWAARLGEPESASRTCEARWCDGGVPAAQNDFNAGAGSEKNGPKVSTRCTQGYHVECRGYAGIGLYCRCDCHPAPGVVAPPDVEHADDGSLVSRVRRWVADASPVSPDVKRLHSAEGGSELMVITRSTVLALCDDLDRLYEAPTEAEHDDWRHLCPSSFTDRDDEHKLYECHLPPGHDGLHTGCHGAVWSATVTVSGGEAARQEGTTLLSAPDGESGEVLTGGPASSGASASAPYPERDGPGTLQDEVRRRLAVIKHNDAEENLTGWNEEGMRVIIRGFISDTESLLRLLDHRAAGSAVAEPDRSYITHPAERAIQEAVDRVEEMGAHIDLTAIVHALGQQREAVAAYVKKGDER